MVNLIPKIFNDLKLLYQEVNQLILSRLNDEGLIANEKNKRLLSHPAITDSSQQNLLRKHTYLLTSVDAFLYGKYTSKALVTTEEKLCQSLTI
jgi:hypothetical protein